MSGAMYGNQIEELGEDMQVYTFYTNVCPTVKHVCNVELESTRGGPFPAGTLREGHS